MAVNITFDGYCYDKSSAIGDNTIYYQAYFLKVNAGSSTSAWNTVRTLENASGYYNINLGSGDWLGPAGSAASGDKVVIAFWKGGPDRTADCNVLTQWGAFEVTLDGSDSFSNDVQIMDNIVPDLHWSTNIPAHAYVETVYNVVNTSEDEHSWIFGTTTMYHWYTRHGQVINGPNQIDSTDIYWGDGNSDLGLSGAAGASHSYDTAGTYEITVDVFDDCTASTSGVDTFNIYWRPPVPNIIMTPANPLPNEAVSFEYTGTDPDDRITSIEWTIEDDGAYGTTNTTATVNRDDTVNHTEGDGTDWYGQGATSGAFTNPGTHTVSVVINWNDGFNDQTINYSENFTQDKFDGPDLDFTQDPVLAAVGSGIVFTNTSTNVDRVGLGLPDHEEYFWNWDDNGTADNVSDVDYAYQFTKVANSAECTIELCADWSDGWDTLMSCVEKAVTFKTTVSITPEDCYYRVNIIGTSDDGTVSGYSWTVSSGTSSSGPWSEVWSSPTGLTQQEKTLCFSSTGWYKIQGYVYGNGATTTDAQTLFIDETCPDSGSVYNIWNGTGALDIGSDWIHTGKGVESASAVYQGTNGMLITNAAAGDKITFQRHGSVEMNINDYDFLSFWVNLKAWETGRDITVKLYSTLDPTNGITQDLSNYLILNQMNSWQRVMIPLKRFRVEADKTQVGWPTHVNQLELYIEGQNNFWLDDVALVMGELITLPVCAPDMETTQVGSTPVPNAITPTSCGTPYPRPINI